MRYANIATLSKSDLEPLGSKLINLRLLNNVIEVIESDVFDANPNLEEIMLDSNQIEFVGKGAFDKLLKLSRLDFYPNPCYSQDASSRSAVLNLVKILERECNELPEKMTISAGKKQEQDIEELIGEVVKCKVEASLQDSKIKELERKIEDLKLEKVNCSSVERTSFETKNSGRKF